MKRMAIVSILWILLLTGIGALLYINRASFPTLRMWVRDKIYELKWTSVITNRLLRENLEKVKLESDDWVYRNSDLDKITDLRLTFEKHYEKVIDLSELRYLKNLKRLIISPDFKSGEDSHRKRYNELTGLNRLPDVIELDMSDFPVESLDWKDFPESLYSLHMNAMGIKEFKNKESLKRIPNLFIYVDIFWEEETYLCKQWKFERD